MNHFIEKNGTVRWGRWENSSSAVGVRLKKVQLLCLLHRGYRAISFEEFSFGHPTPLDLRSRSMDVVIIYSNDRWASWRDVTISGLSFIWPWEHNRTRTPTRTQQRNMGVHRVNWNLMGTIKQFKFGWGTIKQISVNCEGTASAVTTELGHI